MHKKGMMTYGTSVTKTFTEWEERLDNLVYPKLFVDIVSELCLEGYEPQNINERLARCRERYDQITPRPVIHSFSL